MATWSVCTRFAPGPEQKVMINLDNVLTIERTDDRTVVRRGRLRQYSEAEPMSYSQTEEMDGASALFPHVFAIVDVGDPRS